MQPMTTKRTEWQRDYEQAHRLEKLTVALKPGVKAQLAELARESNCKSVTELLEKLASKELRIRK
jgi:hypothetical protein